jgi:hypothetical protein
MLHVALICVCFAIRAYNSTSYEDLRQYAARSTKNISIAATIKANCDSGPYVNYASYKTYSA